jgi:hypothetical protein
MMMFLYLIEEGMMDRREILTTSNKNPLYRPPK